MKNKSSKPKKIILESVALIAATVVAMCAAAVIYSTVLKRPFAEAFGVWQIYVIIIACLIVVMTGIELDIRLRGSRRVLKVNVDLENSHFMEMPEIKHNEGYTITKFSKLGGVKDGVPVMAVKDKDGKDITVVLKTPIHTMYIGATGSGKTTAGVEPTIAVLCRTKTKPSMVITDPKGELYVRHADELKKQGYCVNLIDLSDIYHSTRWNPFNDIWRKTDVIKTESVEQRKGKYYYCGKEYLTLDEACAERKANEAKLKDEIFIDLQDLIYTICPIENKMESSWQKGARDLILAITVAFWEDVYDGFMPREKFNLYNIYRTISDNAKGECEELRAYFDTRSPESKTRGLSNTVLVAEDRTLSSFLTDVSQYFNWMADTGISALTSGNDVEFSDFDEKANVLFLKIPDEKENRHKLVALFMMQMYKALVDKARKNLENADKTNIKTEELLRNVYFIMDEFGNLPAFYKIDSFVTVGRSRRIFLMPVIQDFNQLDNKYGKDIAGIIRANCNIQIFIGSNDKNTREEFSELCGKKKAKQVSYSEKNDMSVSTSAQSVPLIYPSELEHLNDPPAGIFGNAIVSCLGNYPLRGKITPYFQAESIYGASNSIPPKGRFIDFDEKSIHYDITKFTTYLKTEERILKSNEQLEQMTEQAGQVGQAEQVEDDEKKKAAAIRRHTVTMLADVQKKIKTLQNKIPAEKFAQLDGADIKNKLKLLNALADDAMNDGSFILSAECDKIRTFILRRCFVADEIKQIENECQEVKL